MKKSNHNSSERWFEIGSNEFKFAIASLKEFGAFYPQICFQFQQAAEKYLKGFLVYNNKRFPKIHDLSQLLKLCAKIDKDFLDYFNETAFLSQFYLIVRYPVLDYPIAEKKEALEASKYAESIIKLVKNKIK